jgi:hypothetical protein
MPDMPDDRHNSNDDAILAVGGSLCVAAAASGRSRVWVGPAAGWMAPQGIAHWERELSFVIRAGLTPTLATTLRATRPDEQIAPKRFPTAKKAVDASPLLGLAGNLVDDTRAQGVRVHTVGVDRVSGDFYYFEEGGDRDPVRVQGNLVEMLSPSIGSSSTNAEIAARMEGLIDRLLLSLSGGVVSELAVELADALPRLSRDGSGLLGTDLVTFELQATAFATRAARWEAGARRIPPLLEEAARKGLRSTSVPLFGEARLESTSALEVLISGNTRTLAAPLVWTVKGAPREEPRPAAARPSPSPVPARPSPSPVPARPSPSPVPARPSPTPGPSRIIVIAPDAPAATKPTPLRVTPIPPRPEPAPSASAPASEPKAAEAAPAPRASASATDAAPPPSREETASPVASGPKAAGAPAPASAPSSEPAAAAAPAAARAAPVAVAASAPDRVAAAAPDREAVEASASDRVAAPSSQGATTRPAGAPPAKKSSSSTLVLALLALAALAYVAFERLFH